MAALLVFMLLPGPVVLAFLLKFTAVLGSSHWPVDAVDMGHSGVSFLETHQTTKPPTTTTTHNNHNHNHHTRLRQVAPFVLVIFAVPLSCHGWRWQRDGSRDAAATATAPLMAAS